jgi:hypothetical protein
VSGAIVRWRIQGAKGGPFYLRVLHPNGSGAYTAIGTSLPATPAGAGLQTFTTNMPIHTGDLIGIDPTAGTDEIGIAPAPGANTAFIFPPPFDGATAAPSGTASGQEIELNAEVQPAPAIASITPTLGSIVGGTKVTIAGTNLNAASAVKFGTTTATSFTVDSETQITATAPPSTIAGAVDVSVTTLAGNNPTVKSDRFTYTACVVPKLKGKKLKAVKNALRRADCRLGKVNGVQSSTAKVIKQSPKPAQGAGAEVQGERHAGHVGPRTVRSTQRSGRPHFAPTGTAGPGHQRRATRPRGALVYRYDGRYVRPGSSVAERQPASLA